MKRFVSLQIQDHSLLDVDPYTITTWMPIGPNTPISLTTDTLQDKDYRQAFITLKSFPTNQTDYTTVFASHRREICPIPANTPYARHRRDFLYLEKMILIKEQENTVTLRAPKVSFIHEAKANQIGLLRVDSPTFIAVAPPRAASPNPSDENLTYVPTKKLLDLKKPRSGIFINASNMETCDPDLNINPREIQRQVNENKTAKYRIDRDASGNMYASLDKTKKKKPSRARGTQITFDSQTITRGTICVHRICADPVKWPVLAISATAFIFSKLVEPEVWTPSTIDEILELGKNFATSWDTTGNPTVGNLPQKVDIKGFRVEMLVTPKVLTGKITMEIFSYVCSEFNRNMASMFADRRCKAVIVEFDELAFVVWLKKDTYYLFDAYNRNDQGRILPVADLTGAAFLMSIAELEGVCQSIYDNVATVNPVNYKMHTIHILRVDKIMYDKMVIQASKDKPVKSSATGKKTSTSAPPLPDHETPSTVPLNELSDISVQGRKKKRHLPKDVSTAAEGIAAETVTQGDLDEDTESQKLMETKLHVLTDTLNDILDDIQDKIDAKASEEPPEKRIRGILVKSDLGCLQKIKQNILRNELDPKCDPREQMKIKTYSFENSCFREMPDRSQVMLGTKNILQVVEYNESIGVVGPVIAIVLANKYSIHTWVPSCLDYILNTTRYVQECVPMDKYSMFQTKRHHLPDLQIGSDRYNITIECLCTGMLNDIGSMLYNTLGGARRVVIASIVYNAAVFEHGNKYYLFDAFPCDMVGLRSIKISEGVTSFQRFETLEELVDRLKCNASLARMGQHCSVNQVRVRNVTDTAGLAKSFRFKPQLDAIENETIAILNQEEKERVERNQKMLDEINTLIKSEKCRIKKYNKRAGIKNDLSPKSDKDILRKKPVDEQKKTDESTAPDSDSPKAENSANGTAKTDPKDTDKKDDAKNSLNDLIYDDILNQPYGYACVSPGFFHKIQGSAYLPYRYCFRANGIRACHFCSMYAASLLAILGGFKRWNFRLIDHCLEEGRAIYANLNSSEHMDKRIIDRVQIKQSHYKVVIEKYVEIVDQSKVQLFYSDEHRFSKTLSKFFRVHNYLLLQFPNVTFAIVQKDGYNLFDPYSSTELREGELPLSLPRDETLKDLTLYKENNSAAWIRIQTLPMLIKYMRRRIRPRDMNVNSQLFTIKCIQSNVRAPDNYAHYMLKYSLKRDPPPMSLEYSFKSMRNEQLSWVGNYPQVFPWSRQHTKNTMRLVRYKPNSTWKAYDVEVEGILYSIWSNLHPVCAVFDHEYRGQQFAGIYLIAGCIASIYPPEEWTQYLMNYIVVEGDRYFVSKVSEIRDEEHEVSLDDLAGTVELASFTATIAVEHIVMGTLYSSTQLNLKNALLYFFDDEKRTFGVLQCNGRTMAFGRTPKGNYFMFDCMCIGRPVFMPWEGAAYCLLTSSLNHLLYCLVLTIRSLCFNIEFHIHSVSFVVKPITDDSGEEETGEEAIEEAKPIKVKAK